jgi:hypothetical protein
MRAIAFDFQLALSVVDATGRAFQCQYITLSNISSQVNILLAVTYLVR